jgi:hypothetical protein
MFDVIREAWQRVVRLFVRKERFAEAGVAERVDEEIPAAILSTSSVFAPESKIAYDFSRWKITEYEESPFEKAGRLYIDDDDLVIRSDLDTRGFRVRLVNVVAVLNGEPQDIRLLKTGKKVGTVMLSTSGKAMNFWIEPFLYTAPLSRVMDVLEGRARKAAVFVGREVVERSNIFR